MINSRLKINEEIFFDRENCENDSTFSWKQIGVWNSLLSWTKHKSPQNSFQEDYISVMIKYRGFV